MQAKTGKKLSLWNQTLIRALLGVVSLSLLSCSSMRLAPTHDASAQDASFFAMGTRWSVSMKGVPASKSFPALKDKLTSFALHYELTFSDWSDESELRKIELSGWGTRKHRVSDLFMEGLLLSQEAYVLSNSAFDITTGAILWKSQAKAVGQQNMELDAGKKSVRFTRDPKRLTFGGIVKGMALGEMSSFLIEQGVESFWIDAGGGNRVSFEKGNVRFESRSRVFRADTLTEKHVFSTRGKEERTKGVAIACSTRSKKRSDLIRWGALSDSFSTARLLDNSWKFPKECAEI